MSGTLPLTPSDRKFVESRLLSRTFPQTVLLEGGSDEARRSLADYLACALVCTGSGARPCGACGACRKCASGSHPDIRRLGPEKKNGTFKVEFCRFVRQDAFVVPNDGDTKVYILDDCQTMNDSAENALLKILEEPPAGVYFLLTCPTSGALLPTIRSRAVALTLTGAEEAFGEETLGTALSLAKALKTSEWALLQATAALERDRTETGNVLRCLCAALEEALCRRAGAKARPALGETPALLSASFTTPQLYALLKEAQALTAENDGYENANLLLTALCYRLYRAAHQHT